MAKLTTAHPEKKKIDAKANKILGKSSSKAKKKAAVKKKRVSK